jgi:glycosyltransferase involved in cell wall biosynthesis
MLEITAVVHTQDDGLRLGRCLETLYPCDEILVVDHGSQDGTVRVAHEYAARVIAAKPGTAPEEILRHARTEWIFCVDARESVSEALAASVYEWKLDGADNVPAFSVYLREETPEGWVENPEAQTRLVPANWKRWSGRLPMTDQSAVALEGELLRFVLP